MPKTCLQLGSVSRSTTVTCATSVPAKERQVPRRLFTSWPAGERLNLMTAMSPGELPGAAGEAAARRKTWACWFAITVIGAKPADSAPPWCFCCGLALVWGLVAAEVPSSVEDKLTCPGQVLQTPNLLPKLDEAVVFIHFKSLAPATGLLKGRRWIFRKHCNMKKKQRETAGANKKDK